MKLVELLSDKKNARFKIIYYSSLTPVTIQEINSAWGYRSPTYLYQQNSLKTLIENKLILEEECEGKKAIKANIKLLFSEKSIDEVLSSINKTIELQVLREYNPTVTKEALELNKFRELAIKGLPQDYRKSISKKLFNLDEFRTLVGLWKSPIFIKTFLPLNVISRFSKNDLSDEPLEFFFKYTCSFYEEFFDVLNQNLHEELEIPYEFSPFYLEEDLPIILKNLMEVKTKYSKIEFESFIKKQQESYSLIVKKFKETIDEEDEAKNWLIKEIAKFIGIGGERR